MRGENLYKDKGEMLVLALLSESYSELDTILVGASRHSSYLTSHYLLTT